MSSNHEAANPTAVETPQDNAPERQNTTRRRSKAKKKTRKSAFVALRKRVSKDVWRKYADILAETASTSGFDTAEKYNATQNGIVIWSPHEKELLFNALDRKGKNGISEIATAIGSKSELEVQEHLKLLHTGLERQHLRDRHSRTIILGDVPAATEIRMDCDRVLDGYAELLRLEEQYLEDINGRKRHQDAWLIDREKAEEVDEELEEYESHDDNDEERTEDPEERISDQEDAEQSENTGETMANSTIHQTAELLHMEKWVRLSERFFMNPGGRRLEDNWNNIAYAGETPSLTADAFVDFYSLALSVTRRIVHSTLFFAMSRLRRMRNSGHRKAKLVKTRDVRAALGVLGMKQKTKSFWIGLARRCSLDVVDARHVKGWKSVSLDHNQVEDYLSGGVKYATTSTEAENTRESDNDNDNDNDDDSVLSDVRSSPERIPEEEPLYLSHEDEHAETLDQKSTRLEENHLYQLLEHPIPSDLDPNINPEENTELPQRPKGERKTREELADWRDRTLYQSEWEEYGREVFDIRDDIAQNRRKRRRIAQDEPSRFASPVSVTSIHSPEGSAREITVDRDDTDTQGVVDSSTVKYEAQNEYDEDFDDEVMDLQDQAVESESDHDQESKPVPSPSQSPRDDSESDHDQESKPVPSPSQSPRGESESSADLMDMHDKTVESEPDHDQESKPVPNPSQSPRDDFESDHDQDRKPVPSQSQSPKGDSESDHEIGSEDYQEHNQESDMEDEFKHYDSSEYSDSETKASLSNGIPFR